MPTERPVFVAAGDRRARWLRYGGAVAVFAGCLWLAALAVGMLGFGLPGVSLPSVGRAAEKPPTERVQPTNPPSARVSEAAATATALGVQRRAAAQSRPKVVRPARGSRRTPTAKASRPTRAHSAPQPSPPTQVVQPVDPQPAPAPAQQGWAERGWTAPPGQTRRTEPAPAAASPGQARQNGGEETTTAPAEPAPAPVPPGQQKKAEDPTPNG